MYSYCSFSAGHLLFPWSGHSPLDRQARLIPLQQRTEWKTRARRRLIPRLHDEAGSTSWLVQLTYFYWTSQLDVCSMFAWSCKRGIRRNYICLAISRAEKKWTAASAARTITTAAPHCSWLSHECWEVPGRTLWVVKTWTGHPWNGHRTHLSQNLLILSCGHLPTARSKMVLDYLHSTEDVQQVWR